MKTDFEKVQDAVARQDLTHNKILEFVKLVGSVDDEHLGIFPNEHPFTLQEFRDYTDAILQPLEDNGEIDNYNIHDPYFLTYLVPIEEDEQKFILRQMTGQGIATTLFTKEEWLKLKAEIDKDREAN